MPTAPPPSPASHPVPEVDEYLREVEHEIRFLLEWERAAALEAVREDLEMFALEESVRDERAEPTLEDYRMAIGRLGLPSEVGARIIATRVELRERWRAMRRTTRGPLARHPKLTLLVVLLSIAVAVVLVGQSAGQESLASVPFASDRPFDGETARVFAVEARHREIQVRTQVFPTNGTLYVRLLDPEGRAVHETSYTRTTGLSAPTAVLRPRPGEWTLELRADGFAGSASVEVVALVER
ncbi:MAG: hypothetical protein ACT4PT_05685 [Methanobacteriota archaeon]